MMSRTVVSPWVLVAGLVLCGCSQQGEPFAARTGQDQLSSAAVEVTPHPDPLAALASTEPALAANKRLVFDMWRSVVNAGQIQLADEMLAAGYIQHSPVLRTGREAFKEIFSVIPRREIPPVVEPPLVASIAERDLVVMSLLERVPARDGLPAVVSTHFNLFRVADGRLAEHWHSVRTAPGPDVPLPGEGGPQPIEGAVGAAQQALLESADPQLARNKRLVFDLWREIVEAGQEQRAADYIATDFVEHGVNARSGIDGFREHFSARPDRPVQPWIKAPVVALVAEGDLVALVLMQELPHPHHAGQTYTIAWFHQFRIAEDRVVEHWDSALPGDAPGESIW